VDIAGVGALLGSLKTATEIAKLIKDSDLSLEKAETKLKLADLVSSLADAKLQAAEIQQSLLDRDEKIRKLEGEAKLRAELKWEAPCYWLANTQGQPEPYCQHCYDGSNKLVRLHSDGDGLFQCRVCSNSFQTRERAERDAAEYQALRHQVSRGIL
jgi:hypothetical protein